MIGPYCFECLVHVGEKTLEGCLYHLAHRCDPRKAFWSECDREVVKFLIIELDRLGVVKFGGVIEEFDEERKIG